MCKLKKEPESEMTGDCGPGSALTLGVILTGTSFLGNRKLKKQGNVVHFRKYGLHYCLVIQAPAIGTM